MGHVSASCAAWLRAPSATFAASLKSGTAEAVTHGKLGHAAVGRSNDTRHVRKILLNDCGMALYGAGILQHPLFGAYVFLAPTQDGASEAEVGAAGHLPNQRVAFGASPNASKEAI